MLTIPLGSAQDYEKQQSAVDKQAADIFRDGKIQRPDFCSIGPSLDHLVRIFRRLGSDIKSFIFPVLEPLGTEDMPARRLAAHYHRQRNADCLAVNRRDVPLVGIADMAVEIFIHVE